MTVTLRTGEVYEYISKRIIEQRRMRFMRNRRKIMAVALASVMAAGVLAGCGQKSSSGKIVVEMVQYKPEAAKYFKEVEQEFNATHDKIQLRIDSPNDAMTILKTRFIREDKPDIIGIGGDSNFSNFLDAGMLADLSDYEGIKTIKENYLAINKNLEYVPTEGVYALPYAANAAGILYNKDMFAEHGWKIPTTWDEFTKLCDTIQSSGVQPLYFGFKDTWTTLAPWNALAVGACDADLAYQVNSGKATFTEAYREVAEKEKQLLAYGQDNPAAYGYNDACTAFARGQSAMYTIGSYAIPQIKSVNPDMNIGSFVFPVNEDAKDNILNSGNDLMFCVTKDSKNKEAAYEVLNFLLEDENIQKYIDAQTSVPCKKGDFKLASELTDMKEYIDKGIVADYQDHHYPSEMSVDAMIQSYLLDNGSSATDTFLSKFDKDWVRYNRDIIEKVKEYEKTSKEGAQ